MVVEYDSAKDEANQAQHGMSLSQAGDIEILAVVEDDRFDYGETRYRAFGLIDGQYVCLVFARRNDNVRAISLRRAHKKEIDRYV